jgi:hypothetical protein
MKTRPSGPKRLPPINSHRKTAIRRSLSHVPMMRNNECRRFPRANFDRVRQDLTDWSMAATMRWHGSIGFISLSKVRKVETCAYPIRTPTLRERPTAIPILVRHFFPSIEFEEDALDMLCRYAWPGNVRQLISTVERLAAKAESNRIIT